MTITDRRGDREALDMTEEPADELEPYPTDRTRRELSEEVATYAIGQIPIVGDALGIALGFAMGRTHAKRQEAWLNRLAGDVHRLKEFADRSFADLAEDDEFVDAVVQATRFAESTHQEEKLAALRNGVLHTLTKDAPAIDERARFFRLLDEFTAAHVRMLSFLDDPEGSFTRTGVPRPSLMAGARRHLLKTCMPEFEDDLWADLVFGDLASAGLVTGGLGGMMSESGLWTSASSPLGKRFLHFISPVDSP
jgi:hypothetical protein